MIYIVTGWPGAGKTTVAVQHALHRYAYQGRRIVSNFPMDFAPLCLRPSSQLSQTRVQVIPDRPSRADLDAIGLGGEREDTAGMLIVDEAGGWLNTRTWNTHKSRDPETGELVSERDRIIDWLTQSRKRFWDIYLIAQSALMLDKQVREAVGEGVVRIRRFDRFRVMGVSMPRCHIAIVRYGLDGNAPVIERWFYRGAEAQKCFGSYRLFGTASRHYSILPPSQTAWRGLPSVKVNAAGRVYLAVGTVGAVLLAGVPLFASTWLLMCALLAWVVGRTITPAKPLWWARRLRRWGGWGQAPIEAAVVA